MQARRDWTWLVRWAALIVLVLLAVIGLSSGDRETLVIAAALLGANALLRWGSGLAGTILAGLLAADIAFWLVPAALTNLINGEGWRAVLVPTALAASSLVLLVAAAFSVAHRRRPDATRAGPLLAVGVGVGTVAVAAGAALLGGADGPEVGDVVVDMTDTAFEPDRLRVPSGDTAFYVTNNDLFWHTFTIEGVPVNVRLPTRGHRRVEIDLDPGTYEVICAVPGHVSLGMTGTLEVR